MDPDPSLSKNTNLDPNLQKCLKYPIRKPDPTRQKKRNGNLLKKTGSASFEENVHPKGSYKREHGGRDEICLPYSL